MCRYRKWKRDESLCNRCRFIKKARQKNVATARRQSAEKAGDKIAWRELGERDGWQCHICNRKVQKRAGTAKQPKGATVDHIVPVAHGGSHTWDNVALAHRVCNTSRGAAGEVQLRLVG
jgi:5-methylcytosine-specific restriction endonuclease McrA